MKFAVLYLLLTLCLVTETQAQDTLVGWTFNNGNATDSIANYHNSLNATRALRTNGGTSIISYTSTGYTTYSAQATGWNSGKNIKCWQVSLNTLGYQEIKVSSMQQAGSISYPGPRDFKLQYKIGNGTLWADVPGSNFFCSNTWNPTAVSNLSLPSACDNQANLVYIRWIMTSDTAVNYNLVMSTGRSKIDNIFFTAVPFHVNPDTSLFVVEYQVNLEVGQQDTLTAVVLPVNASNRSVTWVSLDSTITKVNAAGKVTAISGGNTYVKATSFSGFTDSCHVIVNFPFIADTSVVLSDTIITMTEGTGIPDTLMATVFPLNATNHAVIWSSDDTSIIKINSNGIITSYSNGQAIVTVRSFSGHSASCRVDVIPPFIRDTSVVLSDSVIGMVAGIGCDTLSATVFPLNATIRSVTWSSEDTNIVRTDPSGIVFSVYPGYTYITAESFSGATDRCRIVVGMDHVGENKPVYLNIYPNPVRDKLYVYCRENISKIIIYNSLGRKVYQSAQYLTHIIDFTDYPKTLYFIIISTNEGEFSRMFIKE